MSEGSGPKRLPVWLFWSLATVVLWGTWGLVSKIASDGVDAYVNQLLFTAGILPLLVFVGWTVRKSGAADNREGRGAGVFWAFLTGILGGAGNMAYYAEVYLRSGSWGLLGLAILGGVLLVRRLGAGSFPVLSGLFYWVVLSRMPLHWERWSLPMLVTTVLLSGIGLGALFDLLARRGRKAAWGWIPLVACSALVLGGQVFWVERKLVTLGTTDTRLAGRAALERLGIDTSNALVSQYSPLAPSWKPGFDFVAAADDTQEMKGRRYAVSSSNMFDRYLAEPERYPREARFYRDLFRRREVLRLDPTVIPFDTGTALDAALACQAMPLLRWWRTHRGTTLSGPVIRVFDLSDAPAGGLGPAAATAVRRSGG